MAAANAGLDQQMPGCARPDASDPFVCDSDKQRPNYFGAPLKQAVLAGQVPESAIDAKLERILTAMIIIGRPRVAECSGMGSRSCCLFRFRGHGS